MVKLPVEVPLVEVEFFEVEFPVVLVVALVVPLVAKSTGTGVLSPELSMSFLAALLNSTTI